VGQQPFEARIGPVVRVGLLAQRDLVRPQRPQLEMAFIIWTTSARVGLRGAGGAAAGGPWARTVAAASTASRSGARRVRMPAS
jgi:hypothetical protein